MATTWFNSGVDVLFAAAGGAGSSAMAAAEELTGKWTIGVDKDQSQDSLTVVTSALKGVGEAAISALTDFYGGTFVGGRTISLGAAEGGVAFPPTSPDSAPLPLLLKPRIMRCSRSLSTEPSWSRPTIPPASRRS